MGFCRAGPDKLSFDDLMIRSCGAPERERAQRRAYETHKWWKFFEEEKKARAREVTKGMIFMRELREWRRPKFQALRYRQGNFQKVGIKLKCTVMLTINTIMAVLPASPFCCAYDACVVFMRAHLHTCGFSIQHNVEKRGFDQARLENTHNPLLFFFFLIHPQIHQSRNNQAHMCIALWKTIKPSV